MDKTKLTKASFQAKLNKLNKTEKLLMADHLQLIADRLRKQVRQKGATPSAFCAFYFWVDVLGHR